MLLWSTVTCCCGVTSGNEFCDPFQIFYLSVMGCPLPNVGGPHDLLREYNIVTPIQPKVPPVYSVCWKSFNTNTDKNRLIQSLQENLSCTLKILCEKGKYKHSSKCQYFR